MSHFLLCMDGEINWTSSALDTSTEKDIQKALQNLVQGRSSLSIAHRLSVRSTLTLTFTLLISFSRPLLLLMCT